MRLSLDACDASNERWSDEYDILFPREAGRFAGTYASVTLQPFPSALRRVMHGLARAEHPPWRHEPVDTPPADAPGAVHRRGRGRAARFGAPPRATTPPPPPVRLGRRGRASTATGALAVIPEASEGGGGAHGVDEEDVCAAPRWSARPAAAAVRAAAAAAPLHAATAAALALPGGGGGGGGVSDPAVAPLRRKRKAPERAASGPLAQLAAFFQQVDETELPEEAEGAKAEQRAAERSFKKARRLQQDPAALAAAALATPSPARAVSMYPCLSGDYDEYAKALKEQGVEPMPLPQYIAMMTRRERPAGAAQPPPRLAGALLSAE